MSDRNDATNLARNILYGKVDVSNHEIETLANAVMDMDGAIFALMDTIEEQKKLIRNKELFFSNILKENAKLSEINKQHRVHLNTAAKAIKAYGDDFHLGMESVLVHEITAHLEGTK